MVTQVQIIPWMLADSNHMPIRMQWLDPRKTVFVGALHGMLNAEGLATIFGDLFGGLLRQRLLSLYTLEVSLKLLSLIRRSVRGN